MVDHIEHAEDLLLQKGPMFMRKLMRALANGDAEYSIKYDGSPSVIVGLDKDGCFVATKSYFNKKPVLYRTLQSIEASNMVDDLKAKMAAVLVEVATSYEKGFSPEEGTIYQGDLIYVGANPTYAKPNVVTYEFRESNLATVGIAFHTKLAGTDCEEPGGVYVNHLPTRLDVNVVPVGSFDLSFEKEEMFEKFTALNPDFLTSYQNFLIKNDKKQEVEAVTLIGYIDQLTTKHCAKLKTDKAKEKANKKYTQIWLDLVDNRFDIPYVDQQYQIAIAWKKALLSHLNDLARIQYPEIRPYIDQYYDYEHEGFVVKTEYCTFKVVDRQRFSSANFKLHNDK